MASLTRALNANATIIHDKTIVNFWNLLRRQWHGLIKQRGRYHRKLWAEIFYNWLCRRSIALSRRGKYFLMIMTQNEKLFNYFSRFPRCVFRNRRKRCLFAVDVKPSADPSTTPNPTVGMAALGASGQPQASIFNFIIFVLSQCLPFSIFYSLLSM